MTHKLPKDETTFGLFNFLAGIGKAQNAYIQLEKLDRLRAARVTPPIKRVTKGGSAAAVS